VTDPAAGARIRIAPLDADNWEEAANLALHPEQRDFIAPNVASIAESRFHPELQPCAIYADETMVGFAMYARSPHDQLLWIYRFMIDKRYQRRGFGLRAMAELVQVITNGENASEINIAYDDHNEPARQLYRRAGFIEGALAPWGERTAKLLIGGQNP
jgi:diamine N-acetyltransferase